MLAVGFAVGERLPHVRRFSDRLARDSENGIAGLKAILLRGTVGINIRHNHPIVAGPCNFTRRGEREAKARRAAMLVAGSGPRLLLIGYGSNGQSYLGLPSRMMLRLSDVPGGTALTWRASVRGFFTGAPSTEVMTSPDLMPAFAAGLSV